MAFTAWTNRASKAVVEAGVKRDQVEQSADDSYYYRVVAPPCVACGQPVADKDFERHRFEKHAGNEVAQPYGKPDSRELLLLGKGHNDLEEKIARYRRLHPGVQLLILGEGTRYGGLLAWVRYKVVDQRGRPGR